MSRSPSSRSPRGREEVGKARDCVGGLCLGHDFGENVDLKQELTARLFERFANSTGVEERHERGSERRGGSSLMKKQTADELSIGEELSR
jgi:hypothetical protein